ncbi:MAG: 2-isopropylmalate synthase [Candidatus Nezhaarchaeota archaeon]|nr:2-isopropylmalate synthase [Candidatus Nezhaarchaeota archaeon]MCX8141315.1 2-isopropylmalate synthase [Candidatus Nezhaarchaeota archaeon]MDW8049581.1 2-isopropylmalate synthase [Nitrososphaerota archaeon]
MDKIPFVSEYVRRVASRFKIVDVRIFDTTLREGEQTPGVVFKIDEKLEIARQLDKLGVDTIEAGFPSSSEEEFKAVKSIAGLGLRAEICALARTLKSDVDCCLKADVSAVHTFIGTSEWHLKYKLKMTPEQVIERVVETVEYIKDHGVVCEFSCEDATRTNLEFLIKVYKNAVNAGVDRINVPDTVGVMSPDAMKYLIETLREHINVPISVHCHNDLGMANANALASVVAGASQVHVTVNGLGERAGHAALEVVVVGLEALYGVKTRIKKEYLTEVSRLIEKYSLIYNPPNYPIVGRNAFAHRSGIHVHGVLEEPITYEPFAPEYVGQVRRIVFGKHSGRHGIKALLEQYGIQATEEHLARIAEEVRKLGEQKKAVMEEDVYAIAEAVIGGIPESKRAVTLKELVVVTGNTITPTASVLLKVFDNEIRAAAIGVGPVDASAKAIEKALGVIGHYTLSEFRLEAVTGGTDSLASVEIAIRDPGGSIFKAKAVDKDIVIASVTAFVDAINKAIMFKSIRERRSRGNEGQ